MANMSWFSVMASCQGPGKIFGLVRPPSVDQLVAVKILPDRAVFGDTFSLGGVPGTGGLTVVSEFI